MTATTAETVASLHAGVGAALDAAEEQLDATTYRDLRFKCQLALVHLRWTFQRLERREAAARNFAERADRSQQVALARSVALAENQTFDPRGAFVYVLRSAAGEPLYVGMSSNVLARLGAHLTNPDRRRHVAGVQLLRCRSQREAARIELRLIREYRPPWNIAGVDAVTTERVGA